MWPLQVWEAEGHAAMRVVAGLEREGLADILGHSAATPRFRVAPDSRALVSAALTQAGINYKVLIHDLGSHIRVSKRWSRFKINKLVFCTTDGPLNMDLSAQFTLPSLYSI